MITVTPLYPISEINTLSFTALPKGYSYVDDYLIRGPHPSIRTLMALKKENVNQVFDFRHHSNFGCKFIERFACKLLGISYKRFPFSYLHNEYPELSVFESVAQKVMQNGKNGGKTLFHCHSSRHRTSHFSAFYFLTKGEPMSVVAQKPDFKERLKHTIQTQIIEKNYFNRTIKNYKGINPIAKFKTSLNNRIVNGVRTAHAIFLDTISKCSNK